MALTPRRWLRVSIAFRLVIVGLGLAMAVLAIQARGWVIGVVAVVVIAFGALGVGLRLWILRRSDPDALDRPFPPRSRPMSPFAIRSMSPFGVRSMSPFGTRTVSPFARSPTIPDAEARGDGPTDEERPPT